MKKSSKKIERLIREIRKAKGISQMELAERVGVSYQQIQKYEKGASALSIGRLEQIAQALDVPVHVFFTLRGEAVSETPALYGRLDDDEQLLLHLFRGIKDKKARSAVIELLEALAAEKK